MSPKGFGYWVALQLALDLGLFILVIFLILKMRALGRLLLVPHPTGSNHAEEIAALSRKIADLELRFEIGENPSPGQFPGSPQHFAQSEPQDSFSTPKPDQGKSLRAQVEELAGRGLSPEEIARRLNMQPAEVKVALDLSRILAK